MFVINAFAGLMIGLSIVLLLVILYLWLGRKKKKPVEDSFSALFEQQPEAWLIMDGISLKTIKANQKAMNMFGIFRPQFLHQLTFRKLFQEDLSEDEAMLLVNAVDNNTFVNKVLDCRSLQGRIFKVNVSISRVYEGNLFCRFADPLEVALPMQLHDEPNGINASELISHPISSTNALQEETRSSAKRENENALSAQESFNEDIFKSTSDAIALIGENQEFVEVNEAFAQLTGYAIDELKALNFDQLIHPIDSNAHQQWFSDLLAGKLRINRTERKVLRKDGKQSNLEFLGAVLPKRNAVVISALDNSEVRQKQHLLLQNRENLLALIENTGEAVLSLDALGHITIVNKHYRSLFFTATGFELNEGTFYEEQLPKEKRALWKENFRKVLQGKTVSYREELKDENDDLLMYEILLYPVNDESGLTTGVSFSGRNITDRIKQEEALKEARDKAENATSAKSEFLAVMSHEIRTPLNGLIGMSDLLNTTNLNSEQKEFVDVIRLSGETLLQLISDILDFSKIEASKMQLEYAPFKVEEVVNEAVTILSGKAKEKNLKLISNVHEDVPTYIIGDRSRLRQVLMNLIGNAIKFTHQGSVTVEIKKQKELHGEVSLEFSVSDTGIGIEKEAAEKLFTAFTQAALSTYRKYGGTGLGLTICKMLVDLMGGKIWVESKIGKGSIFYFSFLSRVADSNEVYQSAQVELEEVVRPFTSEGKPELTVNKNIQILLAEDNDINRLLAGKLFERLGYSIHAVTNGKEAYQAVKNRNYDLVFMDVQMPEWDGLEATQRIRAELPSQQQPIIIAMTAFAGDDDKLLCAKAGMDDYLSKPISLDDIEKMILKWSNVNKSQIFENNMKRKTDLKEEETLLINQAAIQRLMDIGKQTDPGFLQQVLDMFIKQAPVDIENIVQGFERGDFALMWKSAHKLKGTCLNIGAQRLSVTCKEIEKKGRNLENSGLLGLCMQLDNEYKATVEELKNLFHYN